MTKINIGVIPRYLIRQSLGTVKGTLVIDFVESGVFEAFAELKTGNIKGFLDKLPEELRTPLLNYVSTKVVK